MEKFDNKKMSKKKNPLVTLTVTRVSHVGSPE